jgi:hypothetical protein
MARNAILYSIRITLLSGICMLLLASCHHNTPPAARREIDPALSPILRALQGSWISYDYTQSINATRSPLRSAATIDGVFSFIIDSARESHDTLYLSALVKGREDNSIWILLARRDSTGCYRAGMAKSRDSDAAPGDNIIKARIDSAFVTIYTAANDSTRYIRYDDVYRGRAADYMLLHYSTRILFSGTYTTRDSGILFRSSQITFDPDHMGRITGSPVYDSFDINIDVLAQNDTLDYMEFFDTRGVSESHSYSYKIGANSIQISPLTEGAPCRLIKAVAIKDSLQ